MGTFAHRLKPNKSGQGPRNWILVDTEASIGDRPGGGEIHTLRLGYAIYRRDAWGDHRPRTADCAFYDPGSFWKWALRVCERDRRLVVVAYNAGYDAQLLDAFRMLARRGYKQTRVYAKQQVCILEWRRGKHKLTVLDACNYFDGTLETWGDVLGLPKVEVNFRRVSNTRLMAHCKRDVEILDCLWSKWRGFVSENDLGHFCVTRSSQAMTAFCHRFMSHDILIHNNEAVSLLERSAYYGGRTECFFIGRVPGKRFWKLDINSMYPYIMTKYPVPIRFLGSRRYPTIKQVKGYLRDHCIVAEVILKTKEPAYPYRGEGELLFPVGHFRTFLCTPELEYALARGHVTRFGKVAIYEKAVVFRRFVQELYAIRQAYHDAGNMLFKKMVKYVMVSLYGKFGQHSEKWESVPNYFKDVDGSYYVLNGDTGELMRYVVIAGQRWNIIGKSESYNSFPAISAHITSAARIHLWGYIKAVGRRNVFYCDTDSLFVNAKGKARIASRLHETELGKLKIEETATSLHIYAPKEYKFGTVTKLKGVSGRAVQIAPNRYADMQWQGLTGAIGKGNLGYVLLTPVEKTLARKYKKGVVHSSGSVSSPSLALASKAASRSSSARMRR